MDFKYIEFIIVNLYLFIIILTKILKIYFSNKKIKNIIIYLDYFVFSLILFYFLYYDYIFFIPLKKDDIFAIIKQLLYFLFFIVIYFNIGLSKKIDSKSLEINKNAFYNDKILIFSIIAYLFFFIDEQILEIYSFYYNIIIMTIVSMIIGQHNIYELRKYLIKTISLLIIFYIVGIIVVLFKYKLFHNKNIFYDKKTIISSILNIIYPIIYAPINEELTFRKLFYDSIDKFCQSKNKIILVFMVILNAFLFYFLHKSQILNNFLFFNILILIFSIISSIIYLKTKNIYLSIVLHSTFNVFALYLQ